MSADFLKPCKERVRTEILNVSYSCLFDLAIPWNTAELYEAACKAGFDGVKGDVSPSADGKLIMCHDSFFNFDENGRVLYPGETGTTRKDIRDMTAAECTSFEYANESARKNLGYHARVAKLETLVSICKRYGKFPYITVRDREIDLCVHEVWRLLRQYDMTEHCIVNSFSPETLRAMRSLDENVCLSLVFGPHEALSAKQIDIAASLGNCVVCVFETKEEQQTGALYAEAADATRYAEERGVVLHYAHAHDTGSYRLGLSRGFRGFQCLRSDAFDR